jgi:hypothetical protein
MHARCLDSINEKDPSSISVLQAAYTMAEFKAKGCSNEAVTGICQYVSQMLFHGESLHPTSLHMVKQVLGVDLAERYEFAWCPDCGYRYPCVMTGTANVNPELTCPRCRERAFKVLPRMMS